MATTFQDSITFAGDVTVSGTLTASGVPTLNGTTLLVNGDAAAGTDQDTALALLGGSGASNLERTTLIQDSSAGKVSLKRQSGLAGTTEASPTLHLGVIGTTAAVNSTLVLEAGASSTNKPASLINTGSTGILAVTATTGVTLSDSVGTLSLNAGAVSTTGITTLGLTASSTAQLSGTTTTIQGSAGVVASIPDNVATAFRVVEGPNTPIQVSTVNNSEAITLTSTSIVLNGAPSGTATITTSAGVGDAGKIPRTGGNGKLDSSILPTAGLTCQYVEYESMQLKASSNTNNVYAAGSALFASGSGCFTVTNSATDGLYATATVSLRMSVSWTQNSVGYSAVRAGASVDNLVTADTRSKSTNQGIMGDSIRHHAPTIRMSAGDKVWFMNNNTVNDQPYENRLILSAVAE